MKEGIRTKRPGYIKFYPERWIFGSTRDEMTNAERAVWMDFLALAYLNDPPGQIDFTSFKRLAKQLNISLKLLKDTIKKTFANDKIKIIRQEAVMEEEKMTKIKLAFDQLESEMGPPVSSRTQVGIPLYSIIITKWNEYQSEYLRQKPYREGHRGDEKQANDLDPKPVTQVTSKGEERRREKIKGKERTGEQESSPPSSAASAASSGSPSKKESSLRGSDPPPSEGHDSLAATEIIAMLKECEIQVITEHEDGFDEFARVLVEDFGFDALDTARRTLKLMREHPEWVRVSENAEVWHRLYDCFNGVDSRARALAKGESFRGKQERAEFLTALQSCPGYPFDEFDDTTFFYMAQDEFPGVEIAEKTKKKVEFWIEKPTALKGSKSPRKQLIEWFEGDFKHKRHGGI